MAQLRRLGTTRMEDPAARKCRIVLDIDAINDIT
jgi:hypothetical protein